MSKASEYAARVAAAKVEPEKFMRQVKTDGLFQAYVTNLGDLYVTGPALASCDALAFADWIRDTFGEES